jgi:magnesium chelatase accessory protein
MSAQLVFERDGRDWPNRNASRFVLAAGLQWHVQMMGEGPVILLLHGTGSSTHSWRDLMPHLAKKFEVIAPDLPGHAFTSMPSRDGFTLPGMAREIMALLNKLGKSPAIIIGHSAGCAIAIRMALDGLAKPRAVLGLNAALLPFQNVGPIYSAIAKLLTLNPFVPWLFAHQARDPRMVERLLEATGSRIDAHGASLYRRLAEHSGHVAGTLRMMANWDLNILRADLPKLSTPLYLLTGMKDGTIEPARAKEAAALVPHGEVIPFAGLGHLAHEERPQEFAQCIYNLARRHGLIGDE